MHFCQTEKQTQIKMSTNTEKPMTGPEALELLAVAYKAFKQADKSRTFMTLAGVHLGKEMSSRGVYETHKMDYYKYMNKFFTNPESDLNAVTLYGIDKVTNYLNALNEVICDNKDLNDIVENMVQTPSEFEQAIAEVAKEVVEELEGDKNIDVAEALKEVADKAHDTAEAMNTVTTWVNEAKDMETKQAPATLAKPKHGLLLDIDTIVRETATEFLLSEKVGIRSHVEDILRVKVIESTLVILPGAAKDETKKVNVKGRLHMAFKEALEVTIIEQQAYLGGATGSGKTTLAEQIAEALELPFAHLSCTAGMSEAHLLGRMIADGSYISSQFVELFENGGVFLLDEIDAADPNTALIINSALANGLLSVPNRKDKPYAKRHAKFYCIAAGNTWGKGSSNYNGRNILDGAFMDRFAGSKIEVNYDTELEKEILRDYPETARRLWKMRDAITKNRVQQNLSTRVFAAAARNFAANRSEKQFLTRFFTGWTDAEVQKVTA